MNPRLRDSRRALALVSLLAAGLLLAAGPRTRAQDAPALEDLAAFPRASLEISARGGTQHFAVWVADTRARQAQGLMFVRDLAPDAGMLFVAQAPREMSMWMKNTYIPLDMIFLDAKRVVVGVVHNAEPLTLSPRRVDRPSSYVVEVPGGFAAKRGIDTGVKARFEELVE